MYRPRIADEIIEINQSRINRDNVQISVNTNNDTIARINKNESVVWDIILDDAIILEDDKNKNLGRQAYIDFRLSSANRSTSRSVDISFKLFDKFGNLVHTIEKKEYEWSSKNIQNISNNAGVLFGLCIKRIQMKAVIRNGYVENFGYDERDGRFNSMVRLKNDSIDASMCNEEPLCNIEIIKNNDSKSLRIRLEGGGVRLRSVVPALKNAVCIYEGERYYDGDPIPIGDPFEAPDSLVVECEKPHPNEPGTVMMTITNQCGAVTKCDPVMATLSAELPDRFALEQNHPNPFNPATTIRFQVNEAGPVHLVIYDALGRQVVTLVDEPMQPGTYAATWDGRDAAGRPMAGGVYLYTLLAGSQRDTKVMTLVK